MAELMKTRDVEILGRKFNMRWTWAEQRLVEKQIPEFNTLDPENWKVLNATKSLVCIWASLVKSEPSLTIDALAEMLTPADGSRLLGELNALIADNSRIENPPTPATTQ